MAEAPAQAIVTKPQIIDDKSPHCIPFILSRLEIHRVSELVCFLSSYLKLSGYSLWIGSHERSFVLPVPSGRSNANSQTLKAQRPGKPFFIGLNGVQGAGKTTLVSALQETLKEKGLETLVCSIDDLYLKHEDQVALAREHPDNALVQHRGEPGMSILSSLLLEGFNWMSGGYMTRKLLG
jgi:D-glycerate 3-kinase